MAHQGHQRNRIMNGLYVYHGDVIGPFVPWNVINNVNYQMMSVPSHGRNQLRTSISQRYAYVQDGHFILNHQVNHVSTRFIESLPRQHNSNFGRNQPRVNTQDGLLANAYVQDEHFILNHQVNHVSTRRFIEPLRRQHNTNFRRNQPRVNTQDGLLANAYVQDGHFLLNHQVNHVSTRRFIEPLQRQHNTNFRRNQPRVNTQDGLLANAYVQDGHFILNHQVNHVSTRRFIEPLQRQYNTNFERNQHRENTQDGLSANAYVQDGHLSFQQNNINQASIRGDIEATQTRSVTNLKRIIIEDGTTDSEPITCSICLMELSNGLIAIQLPSPCSHMYHEDCIMKWLDRSNTCPLCRRPIS